jgi:hypothetical protein
MEILEQNITVKNSCTLIGKAKDIFSPLKETITNSLDAIAQKQKTVKSFLPAISASVHFKTSKDMFGNETHLLDSISIEDNGIGFTTENFSRFKTLGEHTRGFNNRGTGKIQIFCRFDEISIDSTFTEGDKWNKLDFIWKTTGEYDYNLKDISTQTDTKTIVKMSGFSGDDKEQRFFMRYLDNIDELKRDILKLFLLRLWIGADTSHLTLTIRVFLEMNKKGEFTFNQSNIPAPEKEETISINTEQAQIYSDKKGDDKIIIEWIPVEPKYDLVIRRFKITNADMDENGVYMCSKDIVVEPFKFPAVRKNANFQGFRYLTSVSSSLLDDPKNVNQSVDGFTFPLKKKTEDEMRNDSILLFNPEYRFIFWDELKSKIGQGLSQVYSDIEGLKEEREHDIVALAMQYGISQEVAEESNIAFNDTEEEATEKLFETQAKRLAKQNIEIQKTYKELKKLEIQNLNPTSEQYRTKFGELSNKLFKIIPQQNKDELARYIIRRDMVVELLKFALKNELAIQREWAEKKAKGEKIRQDNEGIIHDLIFKRRMKGAPNDLWILNEEFVHFEGYSDIEIDKLEINGEKLLKDKVDVINALQSFGADTSSLQQRPDIFLFPEEGKCILVEFKAPDKKVSYHCDQIQGYARLIANYANRRFFQFFGFLIGEDMGKERIPGRYNKVPYGNYWVYPDEPIKSIDDAETPIASLYQEIMPLSEIAKRAEIRNKNFAEKLGITADDIAKAKEAEGDNKG